MASCKPGFLFTPRDFDILLALSRCPLSTEQLLKLSHTFSKPFATARLLRRRMQALARAGWVNVYQYASTSRGVENYYKLTSAGFRLLNGPKAPMPRRSFFRPVSLALQEHTRALSEFLVHTLVSVHDAGTHILSFHRENDLRLSVGGEQLLPDAALQLGTSSDDALNFFIEMDNGTEPVCSRKERESWQQKISFYERYQDICPRRFRVLIVSTRNTARHCHILETAAKMLSNLQRRLFYAVSLPTFLLTDNGIVDPCFEDHLGDRQSLIPPLPQANTEQPTAKMLDRTVAIW